MLQIQFQTNFRKSWIYNSAETVPWFAHINLQPMDFDTMSVYEYSSYLCCFIGMFLPLDFILPFYARLNCSSKFVSSSYPCPCYIIMSQRQSPSPLGSFTPWGLTQASLQTRPTITYSQPFLPSPLPPPVCLRSDTRLMSMAS